MNIAVLRHWGTTVLVVVVIGFALYSNGLKLWENSHLNRQIRDLQEEVTQKEQRNQRLSLLINYYQTISFQETEARRRLALKKPDEKVLIVKGIVASNPNEQLDLNVWQVDESTSEEAVKEAGYKLWWKYFFHSSS